MSHRLSVKKIFLYFPPPSYEYAKTILTLMTKEKHPDGKVLIIGGGIANFTNVAATFKGIVSALQRFKDKLQEYKVQIFIRRGGPNYQVCLLTVYYSTQEK